MKRFIVLLIVLAGGLAAAAFAVPSNAATVNGVAISQAQVSSDLTAIASSSGYQCFLNAEQLVGTGGQSSLPPVDGVGQPNGTDDHPTATTAFASNYVDTLIGHQLVRQLVAQKDLPVLSSDLATARTALKGRMTAILQEVEGSQYACTSGQQSLTADEILSSLPASFVQRTLEFDAAVSVFEDYQAGEGSSTADLQDYFHKHASDFDTACFTVAEYATQAEAEAAAAAVAAGTPFAEVAGQATGGGPQGCDILYGVSSSLPAGSNLQDLPVGTVSSPIAVNGSYLLIQVTSRTPSTFSKARSEVQAAVEQAGADKARTVINAAEKKADISVDRRYGDWIAAKAEVIPPPAPLPGDVLNAGANVPRTGTSQAATPATGQTP